MSKTFLCITVPCSSVPLSFHFLSAHAPSSLEKFALPCFVQFAKDRNFDFPVRAGKYIQRIKAMDYLKLLIIVNFPQTI